jgi:hypothetical protein
MTIKQASGFSWILIIVCGCAPAIPPATVDEDAATNVSPEEEPGKVMQNTPDEDPQVRESSITYESIVQTGDPIPNSTGSFAGFTAPVINNAGHVLFTAKLADIDCDADLPGTQCHQDAWGLFLSNGSSLVEIARTHDVPPEGNGRFDGFQKLTLSEVGDVVFTAHIYSSDLYLHDNTGVYLFDGQSLVTLLREDSTIPDGSGRFGDVSNTSEIFTDGSHFAFKHGIRIGSGTSEDDEGIFLADEVGIEQIYRQNEAVPAPGFVDIMAFDEANGLVVSRGVLQEEFWAFRSSNWSQFIGVSNVLGDASSMQLSTSWLRTSNTDSALLCVLGGAHSEEIRIVEGDHGRTVVVVGDSAPDGNGIISGSICRDAVVNSSGEVAIRVRLEETVAYDLDNWGIFLVDQDSDMKSIVRTKEPVPGEDVFFAALRPPTLNMRGQIAFTADTKASPGRPYRPTVAFTDRLCATDNKGELHVVVGPGMWIREERLEEPGVVVRFSVHDGTSGGADGRQKFFNDSGVCVFAVKLGSGDPGRGGPSISAVYTARFVE